jgi:hypothetical protein
MSYSVVPTFISRILKNELNIPILTDISLHVNACQKLYGLIFWDKLSSIFIAIKIKNKGGK